mgnify:CR=1 FL=1
MLKYITDEEYVELLGRILACQMGARKNILYASLLQTGNRRKVAPKP